MTTNDTIHIAYTDRYLDWRLGANHPTNPERAQIAVETLLERSLPITMVNPDIMPYDAMALSGEGLHDSDYVLQTLDGYSNEWSGRREDLGATALLMYAGTARLTELMVNGEARVAFNPQGAKHHAMHAWSSGFCVFNDMAWAAREFASLGMRVMYVDWDAHHGDGVEAMLLDRPDIVTASIHDGGIFPGTGQAHMPEHGAYNWPLGYGAGDVEFRAAIDDIVLLANDVKPDVVLLATGADGHVTDPLSTICFDYPGYAYAAEAVAGIALDYSEGRVLIGGAGGYQPHTHTPLIWADVVSTVAEKVFAATPTT